MIRAVTFDSFGGDIVTASIGEIDRLGEQGSSDHRQAVGSVLGDSSQFNTTALSSTS